MDDEPQKPAQDLSDVPLPTETFDLDIPDEPAQQPSSVPIKPPTWRDRWTKRLKSPKFWVSLVVALLFVGAFAWFITPARWFMLNAIGLKTAVTITAQTTIDPTQKTAPLPAATITIGSTHYQANNNGVVNAKVPFGDWQVSASKPGYQANPQKLEADFDPFFKKSPPPHLTFTLKNVGIPLTFKVVDYVNSAPVVAGQFSVGAVTAQPDGTGTVNITIPPTDAKTVAVAAKFGGTYADQTYTIKVQPQTTQQIIALPQGRDYFISNRSGNLGIYSSNVDGTQVAALVPPSAGETSSIGFVTSPTGNYGVLATTRDGIKDASGVAQQKLYVVNLATGALTAVDQATAFKFAGWSGDTVVYAATNATSQRLASVNCQTAVRTNLATGNSFGDVRVGLGYAVYIVTATAPTNQPEVHVVPIKGGTEQVLGYQAQRLTQPDASTVAYQTTDQTWHQYDLNAGQVKNSTAPASTTRRFVSGTSADGQYQAFTDQVDGKPVLMVQNIASGDQKQLYVGAGLRGPVRWSGNYVIFSVGDDTQSADYIVAASGGQPKKIVDVTIINQSQLF